MRHKQNNLFVQYQDKLSAYQKKHSIDASVEEMLLSITEADPDNQQFKNSKWLIHNLLNEEFLWEDIESGKQSKAYDTLNRFLKIRQQWPENNFRDINQYQGLSGIAEKIRPFEIQKTSGDLKREERAKVYDETIVVYDKDDYLVVIPKTEFASCYWGRNTEWCTAATKSTNHFDYYNQNGPLIIAITPDNKKYQFHCNSVPMDNNDQEIKNIDDNVLVELAKTTGKVLNLKHRDWSDPEFCKIAVQQYDWVIRQLSLDTPNYSELCKLAVQKNGWAIQYIPPDTPDYPEIVRMAVQQNFRIIELIDPNIPGYPEIAHLAVQKSGSIIGYIPPNTLNYFEMCKLAIQWHGTTISGILPRISRYSELAKLAVQNTGIAIQHISPKTLEYPEICKLAVQQNGMAIQYISPDTLGYTEICKLAVQQNGMAIQYISPDILVYTEICKLAVQQDGRAIPEIAPETSNYLELCELAEENKRKKKEDLTVKKQKVTTPDWITNKSYEEIIQRFENLATN